MHPRRPLLLLLGLAALAPHLAAQHLITRLNGAAAGDKLGLVIANSGDIDDDGVPDVAFGVPEADPNGAGSGQVKILSGATGQLIRTWNGAAAGVHFGSGLGAVGDVNGDGQDDLAVGIWGDGVTGTESGRVVLISGANGSELWSVPGAAAGDRLGWSLASLGDVDGDGYSDLAVGAPLADVSATSAGAVHLLSGFDGASLHVFPGANAGDQLGRVVAAPGDLDDDGVPDLVGATEFPGDFTGALGLVRGWSGDDYSVVLDAPGTVYDTGYGTAVAGLGDVDGDDHDDLAVGLPFDDALATNAGRVQVLSGVDGSVLFEVEPPESSVPIVYDTNTFFGASVAGLDDLDGDGVPEFAVGESQRNDVYKPFPSQGNNAGAVHVIDGSDGSIMYTVYGTGAGCKLGSGLGTLDDLDGDGRRDWGAGQPGAGNNGTESGEGRVYASTPNWKNLGFPLGGAYGAPALTVEPRGGLFGDKPVEVTLDNALENALVVMIIGLTRIDAPVEGGTLVPAPDIFVVFANGPSGSLAFGTDFPTGIPAGFQFWIQDWIQDPAGPYGWSASNALEATTP